MSDNENKHVMVVEDDGSLRAFLIQLLELHGYHVIACENGTDALNKLHQPPKAALILLDLYMPDTDGWGFRAIQRHLFGHKDTPVVIMSGARNIAIIAAEMGAASWLQKPLTPETVLEVVGRYYKRPTT